MATENKSGSPWWSEEILRREYVERGRSKPELAEEWGCTWDTIDRWLRKHGIPDP